MGHEILSVKLCELDEKIGELHSRIRFIGSAGQSRLQKEIQKLEEEYIQTRLSLGDKLKFSKASYVFPLANAFTAIEEEIQKAAAKMDISICSLEDTTCNEATETTLEKQTLLAEYSLDFALLAANRALLSSLKAIETQKKIEKQEERKIS